MKFEHEISKGTSHISCFYIVQPQILSENCQKRAPCADRRPLRRGTIALRVRFRQMGACQN